MGRPFFKGRRIGKCSANNGSLRNELKLGAARAETSIAPTRHFPPQLVPKGECLRKANIEITPKNCTVRSTGWRTDRQNRIQGPVYPKLSRNESGSQWHSGFVVSSQGNIDSVKFQLPPKTSPPSVNKYDTLSQWDKSTYYYTYGFHRGPKHSHHNWCPPKSPSPSKVQILIILVLRARLLEHVPLAPIYNCLCQNSPV